MTGGAAVFLDFFGHIAGGGKTRVVGIDESSKSWCLDGKLGECCVVEVFAIDRPLTFAFLNEPEPRDVFEESHAAGVSEFVAEACFKSGIVGDCLRGFEAHDRPCARGQPEIVITGEWYASDGGCCVVARRSDDWDVGLADKICNFFADRAEHGAGFDDIAENLARQTKSINHGPCPIIFMRVK